MPRFRLTKIVWMIKFISATLSTFFFSFKILASKTSSFFLVLFIYCATITIASFGFLLVLSLSIKILDNPARRPFGGYESLGKTVGAGILFIGNIGLYYHTEKSIDLLLLFLSLAHFALCTLFFIEPYTSFGIMEFFLGASMNLALSLFGLRHVGTWLVLFVCFLFIGLSYRLDRVTQLSHDQLTGRP